METIYLTGYHGVGKTFIGRLIASRKDLKFLDIDTYIKEKEQIGSIEELISSKGKEYYDSVAKNALNNVVEQGMIISLSSSMVKDYDNIHTIKKSGRVIYLRGTANSIYEILKKDKSNISELENNFSIFTIEKKLSELKCYYEELANYIIDIDNKKLNDIFKEALAIYNFANKVKCHIYIK